MNRTPSPQCTTTPAPEALIRVMLIDDDPDCRMLVRDALEESRVPHVVHEAEHGLAALHALASGAAVPDLIFLDMEMPQMDGLATLAKLRQDRRLACVPIVMMTGVDDPHHMREAARLGANSYTVKPGQVSEFFDLVRLSVGYWLHAHARPAPPISAAAAGRMSA